MKIFIAESAGVCFGVERALNLSEKALNESQASLQKVSSLGPLIHNPQVVNQLSGRGLQIAENIDDVPKDTTIVFRSHGVPASTQQKAKELGADDYLVKSSYTIDEILTKIREHIAKKYPNFKV
jgi:4-hydroxy-3-methylbut-2-enyl diphosphate reductase